jgi:hypothetical protein
MIELKEGISDLRWMKKKLNVLWSKVHVENKNENGDS